MVTVKHPSPTTGLRDELAVLYHHDIVARHKQPHLVMLVAFLITVGIVRTITYAIHRHAFGLSDVTAGGIHIHHFVWGIALLLLSGYLAIACEPRRWQEVLAVAYGIGAGLTLDEFALWVHLRDVYWTPAGQSSLDAIAIVAGLLTLGVLGGRFWLRAGAVLRRRLGRGWV